DYVLRHSNPITLKKYLLFMFDIYEAASDPQNGFERISAMLNHPKFDLNAKHPSSKKRAFHFAAQSGSLITLSLLITHHLSDFKLMHDGAELLMFAEQNPNPEIASYVTSLFGGELHKAIVLGQIENAIHLININFDSIWQSNQYQQTPLYYAAALGLHAITTPILRHPKASKLVTGEFYDLYLGHAHHSRDIADMYLQNEDYYKAYDLYHDAITHFSQMAALHDDDHRCLAHCYSNCGLIQYTLNNLKQAFFYYKKAASMLKQITELNNADQYILSEVLQRRAFIKDSLKQDNEKYQRSLGSTPLSSTPRLESSQPDSQNKATTNQLPSIANHSVFSTDKALPFNNTPADQSRQSKTPKLPPLVGRLKI
ncbi:MAG TPA: tetratricopeptide repeat protein, partial [Legionellaceae bacterium]|nr:tetratricopeptide repeat protein [Legionellaceae bacterium]